MNIIDLKVQSCEQCTHAFFGNGIFCGEYRELVVDEAVAAECPAFEPNCPGHSV